MTELLLAQHMSPLCVGVGIAFFVILCVIMAITKARGMQGRAGSGPSAGQWQCGVGGCHAWNPSHARFCRMCGKERGSV